MNHQTNRSGCSCGNETRCNACPYGRTPWGTREACSCGRRPWNTRGTCDNGVRTARATCSCSASTTWKNRGEGCPCGAAARTNNCACQATARATDCGCSENRSGRSCAETRQGGDCDEECNHGAKNTGILDGKSLAMVYSPYQSFDSLYDPREGLCNGTIFSGLNKPFYGDRRGC